MDKIEAKRLLQSWDPRSESSPVAGLPEALVLAETDAELQIWWQTRQAFDQRVASKLAQVPVPVHLRGAILKGDRMTRFPKNVPLPYWLAAAAALVFFAVAGWHPWENSARAVAGVMPIQEYNASLLSSVDRDPSLAVKSSDQRQLIDWLKTQGSPTGALPSSLAVIPAVGCKTMAMQGNCVSLICFALQGGGLAHLFIVDKKALSPPPPLAHPAFAQNGSWAMASWSDGDRSYVLATRADMSLLHRLL